MRSKSDISDICSHSKPKLQVGLWAKCCIKLYKILCNLKGQIPCGIFRKQNQIAFSYIEFPQTAVVTPAVIFSTSGLSHCYLRKKRRSLALVVRIQFKFSLFWFHFVVRINFNLFWIHSHCLVILGEALSPLCNPNFLFFQRKTLNLKKQIRALLNYSLMKIMFHNIIVSIYPLTFFWIHWNW